jgi:hypothetical protein
MTITLTREEAQQVHDALLYFEGDISDVMFAALTTLRARLAQPEPEPVACAACSGRGWYTCGASDMRLKCPECKGKKAAPPQREWQGLTANEMMALFPRNNDVLEKRIAEFALAIEAKLKEKNT